MFEIGSDQGEDVKNLMEQAGYTGVSVKKDLAGLDGWSLACMIGRMSNRKDEEKDV